jgi:hypothetical protein
MREPFWMDEMFLGESRPQGWLDQHGRPRRTMPCSRCGSPVPIYDQPAEVMRLLGWRPWGEVDYVAWCGHKQEFIALPTADGGCELVPIMGEAA